MLAGGLAMVFVGGSVAVSGVLSGSPLFTAQAVRYTAACLLLLATARLTGQLLVLPRGAEWAWLLGVAATGLVVFNLALVEGSRHAEPAVFGVAVACVPLALAVVAPLMDGGRPRPVVLLAALVVTCGAALVQGVGRSDLVGLAWAAVVLACEAGFTLLAVPVLRRHGPWGCRSTRLAGRRHLRRHRPGPRRPVRGSRLTTQDLIAVGYLAVAVTAVALCPVVLQRPAAGRRGRWVAHRRRPRRGRHQRHRSRPPSSEPALLAGHCGRRRRPRPGTAHQPPPTTTTRGHRPTTRAE